MPRLSLNARRQVITLHNSGLSVAVILKRLREENVLVKRRSLHRLIKKFRETMKYTDLDRRKQEKKSTKEMAIVMNSELETNDEATAMQLRNILIEKYPVSLSTVKRQCQQLGWVCTRPHYCQLIRDMNKVKRLVWCLEQLRVKENFTNVIFSDECTIQLEHHGRLCFRKRRQPRKLKQRPKHPAKLHIWGAISS